MAVASDLKRAVKRLDEIEREMNRGSRDGVNRAAHIATTAIRREMPTRVLRSGASVNAKVKAKRRTGRRVNWFYKDADAERNPTALVAGRGPVHLLEEFIGEHDIAPRGRKRRALGPAPGMATRRGRGGTKVPSAFSAKVHHPGVKRVRGTGPYYRGITKSRPLMGPTISTSISRRLRRA